MISVFYDANINPLRKLATKKAVACWLKQSNLPREMMFVELGFNGKFTFSKEDFPEQIDYIRIDGNDSHKYLFQKEYLWNMFAKKAKYDKLMFIDSDISPKSNVDWFKKVFSALDKCLFTQGFHEIIYLNKNDASTSRRKYSYTSTMASGNTPNSQNSVPGGVYCIRKIVLEKIGWFNNLPLGGGDNLFWSEYANDGCKNLMVLLQKRHSVKPIVDSLTKSMKVKRILPVYVTVAHFYHGDMSNRSHTQRSYLLLSQYPWKRIVSVDTGGLLAWVDQSHYFKKVISNLHSLNDRQDKAAQLMSGHIDYNRFVDKINQLASLGNQASQKQLSDTLNKILESVDAKRKVVKTRTE